jgi:hypothetical protein
MLRYLATGLVAIASCSAGAAVTVEYGDPDRFTDAGDRNTDPVKVMKALANHLKALGDRELPQGTDVRIEVLDLDRAGRPRLNLPTELRVMTGRADPPCAELRYTVTVQGKAGETKRERVCDPDYLGSVRGPEAEHDPLVYEKAMLARWFRRRFVTK